MVAMLSAELLLLPCLGIVLWTDRHRINLHQVVGASSMPTVVSFFYEDGLYGTANSQVQIFQRLSSSHRLLTVVCIISAIGYTVFKRLDLN